MITINDINDFEVRFVTMRDVHENLIDGVSEDSRQWEIARDGNIVFSIARFKENYLCYVCNRSDFGWMRIGHSYQDKDSPSLKVVLTSACCKCGSEMCSDSNEAISYMLGIIEKEKASIVSGSMWKKAANGRSYWGEIGGEIYQVGPIKKNPLMYWARNPDGFLTENFVSLEIAKLTLMRPVLEDIEIFKPKLNALYK